jgi:hypothetical protein
MAELGIDLADCRPKGKPIEAVRATTQDIKERELPS